MVKKYGLIADIHSNYHALVVALDVLDRADADKILCLGDIVGYGGEPELCMKAVRSRPEIDAIAGNHDRQVIGVRDHRMRETAVMALEWTHKKVGDIDARYLRKLPQGKVVDDEFVLVHGSLVDRDAYILSPAEIRLNIEVFKRDFPGAKVCFFGHTHVPTLIGTRPGSVFLDIKETRTFKLSRKDIYLINPGSVGQPRDKCPLASFAVFDVAKWSVTFIRKEYDVAGAQKAIREAGLPERFAERLAAGS